MSRRNWALVILLVVLTWRAYGGCEDEVTPSASDAPDKSAAARRTGRTDLAAVKPRIRSAAFDRNDDDGDGIVVTGRVIDVDESKPVGDVEVVFRNPLGEESTTANADGTYRIRMPAGVYRAFVRDEVMISIGMSEGNRVPGAPSIEMVSLPDEFLMPIVVATKNVDGVELTVVRGGTIAGEVVDPNGNPVAEALVWLDGTGGRFRPTLGTDIVETDARGMFEMRVPAGYYSFGVQAARYSVITEGESIDVEAGDRTSARLVLGAGCSITGRVYAANGQPTVDGVLEMQSDDDLETVPPSFSPVGRVEADGTFKFATYGEARTIALRAWPWKSAHSDTRRFACKDGARFTGAVLRVGDRKADISGVLIDAAAAPVPFAFLDLAPMDDGGLAQQERSDAEGEWGVFNMPAGRYRLSAHSPGKGFAVAVVTSPSTDQLLQLGGVGKIAGTTASLQDGSFEIAFDSCTADDWTFTIGNERRLVPVTAGHFEIDNVPACALAFSTTWHDQSREGEVIVPVDGTAQITVDIGPPFAKTVRGRITDSASRPVPNIVVTANTEDGDSSEATTDAAGRYSIATFSGATLYAFTDTESNQATVSNARVTEEQLDFQLEPLTSSEDEWESSDDEGFDPDDEVTITEEIHDGRKVKIVTRTHIIMRDNTSDPDDPVAPDE